MVISALFSYSQMEAKHHVQLKEEINISVSQLKDSVAPYIESFSPAEYLHLINNEMKHENILAIVIEDYQMGNILGQASFISGQIKDDELNVFDYNNIDKNHLNLLTNTTYKNSSIILSKHNDEKIGKVTVYGTDMFLKDELNLLIMDSVLVTMVIYILLISGIYYGINLFMIDPIKQMLKDIEKTDVFGTPLNKLSEKGSKEIVALSHAMNNMIDTIKTSKSKLLEQKEEFEMIFNSSQDGIAIVDFETKFLKCNHSYLNMTGYTEDELLDSSCLKLTLKEDIPKASQALEDTIKYGKITNLEKSCLVKDNNIITVNMSMSLLPDKKRILLTVKDVTQLKIMESQAKLASMGEMIGNIAHQWRQPLSIISTSASGAKIEKELGVLSDEQFNKHMDSIVDQTLYLSNTIDDFRNFIKEGSKKPKMLMISALLERTLTLAESSFKNNYIELVKNIDDDMEILGYENELIQALINIFNNAKDAIKENVADDGIRVVFLETKEVHNGIEISIKDNGGGIPKEILNRVFEPYFTTKHQNVGTGIGLSLARSILTDHHNAKINLNNEEYEYKGEKFTGACFKITFIKNTDS